MRKLAALPGLIFLLLGLALVPWAGIEGDEAFFAGPLFTPFNRDYGITIFHQHIPLMVFPYAGTLKTLLYWPILHTFTPGAWSIRIPAVLIGAVTIVLFFHLAERMAGARAALLSCLLLATDPAFLITDTYDWGPVAIEHLLLIAGCLSIALRRPALGFFCFGLALWNKAVFGWALAGLAAGALTAYPPEVRRMLSNRRLVIHCACAFIAGALPLIVYNFHRPVSTFRSNVHLSPEGFRAKVTSLRNTLDGSDFFGIVASVDPEGKPKTGGVSAWIAGRLGPRYRNLFVYGILLALAAAPLWWRSGGRRAAIFAIVFSTVAFLAMALTRYTGAAHHVVLIYPMPHLLAGVALAAVRPRWLVAILILANLLVINEYIAHFERNGAHGLFSDAGYALSDALSDTAGDTIYPLDYGIGDSLILTHQGRLNLRREWPVLYMQEPEIQAMLANPRGLFIDRVASREYYRGAGDRLNAVARAAGYEKRVVRTIQDSNGRPQFELFRFHR